MPINHSAAVTGSASSLRSAAAYTGAVYNLNERYEKKLDERFKTKSYTDSGANLNGFNWTSVNTIQVETEGVGEIKAYDFGAALGSRMGAMHEISDQMNVYKLKQYYSIRETYEKLYSDDKMNERKIQRILKGINDEKLVPAIDKYRLKTWADGAGTTTIITSGGLVVNSSGTAAAMSTSNVVRMLLTASAMLDNMRVPMEGRMAYIGLTDAIEFQLADELKYQQEFTNKGAVNGAIRKLGRVTVIAVPDSLMPTGAKIILKWKKASVDPRKLSWSKVYPNVEGYSGPVLNGLYRYDSFVLSQKANGIMVIGDSAAAPQGTPTAAVGTSTDAGKIILTSTLGSSNADNIFYTLDGHNPKVVDNGSAVVLGGTATSGVVKTDVLTSDCYIQAYATKSGKVASGIGKWFFDATAGTVTALSYDEEVPI